MASITTFFRLEPDPLRPDVTVGATAPLHDPLWLLARQWQTGEFAVVARVHAVDIIIAVVQRVDHIVRQRQLRGFGFAAGEVEVEFVAAQRLVALLYEGQFRLERRLVQIRIAHDGFLPFE